MVKIKNYINKNCNLLKALVMFGILLLLCYMYMTINVNPKFKDFITGIRKPKLITMLIAGFCIGTASVMFQSITNNRIITPCLLGMNSLYILVRTTIAFIFGATSAVFLNRNLSFLLDTAIMSLASVCVYGYLFKKTKYNVLYVLLAGTVMATLFGSISTTMARLIDPNQYDVLLSSLIASFENVNADIIIISIIMTTAVLLLFGKDIKLLDAITLGKNQAINLGVDFDKTVSRILIAVTLLIAVATALVGPISFLGLIIANLARESFKTFKHSYLIIGSSLLGGIILIGGQTLIEHSLGFGTQISTLINLFGGGYFLYLILKNK